MKKVLGCLGVGGCLALGAFAAGPQQGERILVESGLSADEAFVVAGTHKLRDGAAVKEM